MTSGIYKLQFANGDFYIGKSTDVNRRWQQHFKSLEDGKHTGPLTEAYRLSGCRLPVANLLLEVHPDLLDEYENYFINNWRPTLNTQFPKPRDDYETLEWYANQGNADKPIGMLIEKAIELKKDLMISEEALESLKLKHDELIEEIDDEDVAELRRATKYEDLEETVAELEADIEELNGQVTELRGFKQWVKSFSWLTRLVKVFTGY